MAKLDYDTLNSMTRYMMISVFSVQPEALGDERAAVVDETANLDRAADAIMRGASLDMIQQARRGAETLVRAELVVACIGAGGRPVRLPQHLRTALAQVSSDGPPRSRHIQV